PRRSPPGSTIADRSRSPAPPSGSCRLLLPMGPPHAALAALQASDNRLGIATPRRARVARLVNGLGPDAIRWRIPLIRSRNPLTARRPGVLPPPARAQAHPLRTAERRRPPPRLLGGTVPPQVCPGRLDTVGVVDGHKDGRAQDARRLDRL